MTCTTTISRTLGLCLVAALAMGCRGSKSAQPPVHLNPNMDNVTYLEAQEPSSFWSDGRAMRPQVPGTVARGGLRTDEHLHRGVRDGAWATTLPESLFAGVPTSREERTVAIAERGQERYEIYCAPCHGNAGLESGGIVAVRGAAAEDWAWAIPSLHGTRQRSYPVGKLYDIVANGINSMPGYAAQISVEDRWAIATYVRALQVGYGSPASLVPEETRRAQGWTR